MSFVTQMGLECIRLNEISDSERQILYDITYMQNIKKLKLYKQILNCGLGKWEKIGQRVQISSYKTNKFWGHNYQPIIPVSNTVLYTSKLIIDYILNVFMAKKKKKWQLQNVIEFLANVVIVFQYTNFQVNTLYIHF